MSMTGRARTWLVVLGMVGMLALTTVGQSYPSCNWNCKSGDVSLGGLHLVATSSCSPGSTVTGTLYGSFTNNTGTDRYDVALIADLVITTSSGTTTSRLNVRNLTSDIAPGTSDLSISQISFPCGASVELRNVIVSWDTKEGGDLSCSSRSVKCSKIARAFVTGAPLVAEFSSSSPACAGQSVSRIRRQEALLHTIATIGTSEMAQARARMPIQPTPIRAQEPIR